MMINFEIIGGLSLGFEFIADEYFSYLLIDLLLVRIQFSAERTE
jgi:hypothetical protein